LEVVFQGRLAALNAPNEIVSIPAPVLVDMPIVKTLWTVQGPTAFGRGQPVLVHTQRSELTQAQVRLDSARSILEAATARLRPSEMSDTASWSTGWRQWVEQLERDVSQVEQREHAAAGNAQGPSADLEPTVVGRSRYDVDRPWMVPGTTGSQPLFCEFLGSVTHLDVRYPMRPWREWLSRVMSALVLVGAVAATRVVGRRPWTRAIMSRYPELIVGVGGVIWWLWFVPSVAGFAILLLAVFLALRTSWTRQLA
jgi:hypothetical protein